MIATISDWGRKAKRYLSDLIFAPPEEDKASPAPTRILSSSGQSVTSVPVATPSQPVPPPVALPDPLAVGKILAKRYFITRVRGLTYSTYYDALDLICPVCQTQHPAAPPDGLCSQCHTPLTPVLIHERNVRLGGSLSGDDVQHLLRFSAGQANILPHWDILQYQACTYAVVKHPGQWGVLVRGRRRRSPDEALAGVVQAGQALDYLYRQGFAHSAAVDSASIESSIESLVVSGSGGGMDIKLADLSSCVPLSSGDAQAMRTQINRDIFFLGSLLFYLATGKELPRSEIELAPPVLRPFIKRAIHGEYVSLDGMLADFSLLPSAPPHTRSLKPSHGQATHRGQHHPRNEDAIVTFIFDKEQKRHSVPMGFFLVADGMGGHDAGDLASRTVNQIVTDWIIKTKVLPDLRKATRKLTTENAPAELLTRAIQQANEMLLRRGKAKGSDLGSTVTAALVIGDMATIASVGDSRTYLLRAGRLEQITQDHSLVARLVDAGVIQPEDVRSHPQRNQIYRCLGHKPEVKVDTFTMQLRRADRLILCSDGLWEMVLDSDIQRLVEQSRTPQLACDALVDAANRAGGEDNIAVIVMEME